MSRQAGLPIPDALRPRVQPGGHDVRALLEQLARIGVRRVYVDGGELIQSFLREDWIDRLVVTTIPVLLGQGRPLWGPLPADRAWTLESLRHWEGGFVQARYGRRVDASRT